MINFKNVTVSYGETVILNNVTFSIPLGKTTCVLGASGSGKTTLLNVLSGSKNYSGKIENLPNNSAYVFQEHRLISRMTVKENLEFFTGVTDVCKIQKILEKVNLFGKENRYIDTLSGGEKQRVAICRALLKNADVILLDEPFNSLDISLRLSSIEILKDVLKSTDKTAVMVTHDISEALYIADKIILLKNGVVESVNVERTDIGSEIKNSKIYDDICNFLKY